jgi:predicted nucleic acid-binding protein
MIDELFLIDTNILVYTLDTDEPEKQTICKELIRKCWTEQQQQYAISVQNLSEFYATVTGKFREKVKETTVRRFITEIVSFRDWKVIAPVAQTIPAAIDLSIEHNIHYWDAVIAATMRENGVFSIYTEDRHFSRIPWLTVVNPF